jgi:TPP-dependent pyruvate/acetoin dehydrogenase alpha subunit
MVCENNAYAEFTPLSTHTNVDRLADHAAIYGVPSITIDGNDVLAVRESVGVAIALARANGGPTLVEAITYRLRGHYEGDPGKYREVSELADWKSKDPLARFATVLLRSTSTDRATALEAIEHSARERVAVAASQVLADPAPGRDDLLTNVYTQ